MNSQNDKRKIRDLMWERLSAQTAALGLDYRIDEQPEDLFVQLANRGRREEVVGALRALLLDCLGGEIGDSRKVQLRFLRRALCLCDSLGAKECKAPLRDILLLEEAEDWGDDLPELQELASKALVVLATGETDLPFWAYIAHKKGTAMPYALNAVIAIDALKGLELFWSIFVDCYRQGTTEVADWKTILRMAILRYGTQAVAEALNQAQRANPASGRLFAHLINHVAKGLGLAGELRPRIEDLVSSYHIPLPPSGYALARVSEMDLKDLYSNAGGWIGQFGAGDLIVDIKSPYEGQVGQRIRLDPWVNYRSPTERV